MADWREVAGRLRTYYPGHYKVGSLPEDGVNIEVKREQRNEEKPPPDEAIWAPESNYIKIRISPKFFTNMGFFLKIPFA